MTPAHTFVPFEEIACSLELDGSTCTKRLGLRNPMGFRNDIDAAIGWLHQREHLVSFGLYRRALDILFNWSIFVRAIPVSSLGAKEIVEFDQYLSNPERWTGVSDFRRVARGEPNWRPFTAGMSPSSRVIIINILKSFYSWMVRMEYSISELNFSYKMHRPTSMLAAPLRYSVKIISVEQWRFLRSTVNSLPKSPDNCRMAVALDLLYFANLNVEQAVGIDFNALILLLGSSEPPYVFVSNTRANRYQVYLIPELCLSIGSWINSLGGENAVAKNINLFCGRKFSADFRKARNLAKQAAVSSGFNAMAEFFDTFGPKSLRNSFAQHISETRCQIAAWRVAAIAESKAKFALKYFPVREPLANDEYRGCCKEISEQIERLSLY